MTFDNNAYTVSFYRDGINIGADKTGNNGFAIASDNPLEIGDGQWNSDLNGTIDEFMIFNRVLTPQEILDLYLGAPINCGLSSCSLADTNGDSVVAIGELISYISRWKNGTVTIGDLITAIGEWKNGC